MDIFINLITRPTVVTGRFLQNRVFSSFPPPVHLTCRFNGIGSLVFCKFWRDIRNLYELVRDRAGPFGKYFSSHKWDLKIWSFFFRIWFILNFYIIGYIPGQIFGKNLVSEIWAKMLLTNQIVGFPNQ